MKVLMLTAMITLGQSYEDAYDRALADNVPLVLGVGVMPPPGPWVSATRKTVPEFEGAKWFKRPSVLLSVPRKGWLEIVEILPASATRTQVEAAIKRHTAPETKHDPDSVPNFQQRMNRRRTSSVAVSAANC